MDRQMTQAKTICLPTLKRGDIIISESSFVRAKISTLDDNQSAGLHPLPQHFNPIKTINGWMLLTDPKQQKAIE